MPISNSYNRLWDILPKYIWRTTLTFYGHVTSSGTWPLTRGPFLMGCSLQLSLHIQSFSWKSARNILASRPSPFRVTWHHRSCDNYSMRHKPFPVDGPLDLQPFSTYSASNLVHTNTHVQIVIEHARYHVTCTPVQNLSTYFNSPFPYRLFTTTLFELRWRIRGVYA